MPQVSQFIVAAVDSEGTIKSIRGVYTERFRAIEALREFYTYREDAALHIVPEHKWDASHTIISVKFPDDDTEEWIITKLHTNAAL